LVNTRPVAKVLKCPQTTLGFISLLGMKSARVDFVFIAEPVRCKEKSDRRLTPLAQPLWKRFRTSPKGSHCGLGVSPSGASGVRRLP